MRQHLLFAIVTAGLCLPVFVSGSAAPPAAQDANDETVRRYVPLLKDADALVRKRAAVALKRLGAKAKSAVPALEEALADKDAAVRAAVADALETIDPVAPAAAKKPAPSPAEREGESPRPKQPVESSPSKERVKLGSYYSDAKSLPSILVRRKDDKDGWRRLRPGTEVFSRDELISLPGFASELRLDSGVHLLLRGHVREFSLPELPVMDYLQESAVVLHKNKEVDADVTLDRGRLYLSNHKDKGEAHVRLRFGNEVWNLTLEEPGSEVVIDLLKRQRGGKEPLTTLFLLVMEGKAGLSIGYNHYPNLSRTGAAFFQWDNQEADARGPSKVESKERAPFAKALPAAKGYEGMEAVLRQLSGRMLADKPPVVALGEALQTNPSMEHLLAIYCLGALDDIKDLINILGGTGAIERRDRDAAIFALRRWLGRDSRNDSRLFDAKNLSGLLASGQEYRPSQAEAVRALLHDFSMEDAIRSETYNLLASYLLSEKPALAELAHWHLARLPLTNKLPDLQKFDAAAPRSARAKLADAVMKTIHNADLPPHE